MLACINFYYNTINVLLIIIINIKVNNDRFVVLGNMYFSACDWRFIWCQFLANIKGNPGVGGWVGVQSQLNIDSRMLSQL